MKKLLLVGCLLLVVTSTIHAQFKPNHSLKGGFEMIDGPYVANDKWFAEDKLLHSGFSVAISGFTNEGLLLITGNKRFSNITSATFTLALGATKEYWIDKEPSFKDLLADVVGTAIGILATNKIESWYQSYSLKHPNAPEFSIRITFSPFMLAGK